MLKLQKSPIGSSSQLAIATLLLILAGVASSGENPVNEQHREGPPSPEERLAHMQQSLGLNDSQSSQVKKILQQEQARHEAVHTEAQQALAKVLTQEQMQKMPNNPRRPQGSNGADNNHAENDNGHGHHNRSHQ